MKTCTIGVVGNPNCGKTTLFNALTGAKQQVGNWPGVTVEQKTGEYTHNSRKFRVVDLPGIYSLSALSVDEQVARDYILSGEPKVILNILDASNLERNLYLTIQLLEMRVPVVIALNMMDIVRKRKIEINIPELSRQLGCPVIPIVASKAEGIEELRQALTAAVQDQPLPSAAVPYPQEINQAVQEILPVIESEVNGKFLPRWAALKLLEGDELVTTEVGASVHELVTRQRARIEETLHEEADILIADSRYRFIQAVADQTMKKTVQVRKNASDLIDRLVLNRILGIPIFLVMMYVMFMFTINLGGAFIDFFDIFAGTIFVDGFGHLLEVIGSPVWLKTLLADGIGGGIQTVATFIPPIAFMFLFLSLLEDSGYMARAAFVIDRFMRYIGLPGKSFVPMLVGFGCTVPAVMATRTLENQRDRTMTILMTPFMSCGARLPVYALFAAAFFPTSGQNLVFGLYVIGIGFAVMTGLILKNTLLQGEASPFVMELPPYHRPTVKGVLLRTWDRLKSFMLRAGKMIILIVVILSFLNSVGTDGSFGNEDSDASMLTAIGKTITPIFAPLGITEENWPATVGIFTGIFAKEAVVGTLDALYAQLYADSEGEKGMEEEFSFWGGISAAFATIPENLAGVVDTVRDPLGLSVGSMESLEAAAEDQEVSLSTFGAMAVMFDGKIGAFAYLLFVLLYFPCVAAIAAVYRETNWQWTLFAGLWTTGLAYLASTLFYQLATFSRHPASSLAWVGLVTIMFAATIFILRHLGQKNPRFRPAVLRTAKAYE
ncbi:MAG: Fe(2+) transporter permease subunit FeoB [Candidatus Vecturithrix sp.]|jgi:ferrous iron transport protein B|nr:Fe(2+) transporter permease subunit FeoB [Candidatus Vecturithrix sp.]